MRAAKRCGLTTNAGKGAGTDARTAESESRLAEAATRPAARIGHEKGLKMVGGALGANFLH